MKPISSLNYEAKQMMLCASVDGIFDDLHEVYVVRDPNDRVECIHNTSTQKLVRLNPVVWDGALIGFVGKCTCGQIFIHIATEGRRGVHGY